MVNALKNNENTTDFQSAKEQNTSIALSIFTSIIVMRIIHLIYIYAVHYNTTTRLAIGLYFFKLIAIIICWFFYVHGNRYLTLCIPFLSSTSLICLFIQFVVYKNSGVTYFWIDYLQFIILSVFIVIEMIAASYIYYVKE